MKFEKSAIEGVYLIHLEPLEDDRGWFSRYFCQKEFADQGIETQFVQFNHSFNVKKGTVRGMHYQKAPHLDAKLIRCINGSVFDVAVDLRKSSKTFLKWISVELSSKNRTMIFIPPGVAHGFQTLEDDTELLYHHTGFYSPGSEGALHHNDPLIGIEWPNAIISVSERDKAHKFLDENYLGVQE
ncbi:MAG: dTDP-4-dehydrorhamnose 3,5-epimerase [Crocinitomicaceae bacterium]|nr:dTDP-4-dehydrorhamnose 3,5-epimerase [Crocinitomicaceae bacterium]